MALLIASRNRLLACCVLALMWVATVAGTAKAHTALWLPDGTEHPEPYQSWIRKSYMPSPKVRAQLVLHSGCTGAYQSIGGCLDWRADGTKDIYLHLPDELASERRNLLYHELGHLFDYELMENPDRNAFMELYPKWSHLASAEDWHRTVQTSAEHFAEAYRMCSRHPFRPDPNYDYSYTPSKKTHRRVCILIRRIAKREGLELPALPLRTRTPTRP